MRRGAKQSRVLASSRAAISDFEARVRALEQLELQRAAVPAGGSSPSAPPRSAGREVGQARGPTESNFSRIYAANEWGAEARSGLGSQESTTREFRDFLEGFLKQHRITSIVDAGCGHWPTGYQRFMNWQGVHYTGLDVVPYVVQENEAYFQDPEVLGAHGLSSAECQLGDVGAELPPGDLLLVKDVLMHLPNSSIARFLQSSVNQQMPKYRMVMLVQNSIPPVPIREMVDIEPGQLLPFDISLPPFSAPFRTIFQWQSDEPKVVQIWESGA